MRPVRLTPRRFLAGALTVAARETAAAFDSAVAYVYLIAWVVLTNAIFMNEFFLTGTLDMTPYFERMPFLLALFLPALTMRLWAEERRQRTLEVLFTLPLTPGQALLGKMLAALVLYLVLLAGSLPIVGLLEALGEPDRGRIAAGYLGLFLLGGLLLALGGLFSALARDQIVAFVLTSASALLLVLLGLPRVVAVIDGWSPRLLLGSRLSGWFSVLPHYEVLVQGLLRISSLMWFLGFTALFAWFTRLVLERRRE